MTKSCPICENDAFVDFNGRKDVRCASCHSLERNRLLWLLLERRGALHSEDLCILHCAPEPGLARRLKSLAAEYVPIDIDISQYKGFLPETLHVDLCKNSLESFAGKFDIVIHNHVLEHLACDLSKVLKNLSNILKPNGSMYFSVPVRKGATTTEDYSDELTDADRKLLFGQHDHVRIFGEKDVLGLFQKALGENVEALDPLQYLSEVDINMYGVNVDLTRITGHSIFVYTKA